MRLRSGSRCDAGRKITEQTSKADREADNKVNSKTDNKTDNKADKKTDNKTDGIRAGKQAADILMRGIGGLKFFFGVSS